MQSFIKIGGVVSKKTCDENQTDYLIYQKDVIDGTDIFSNAKNVQYSKHFL